MNQDELDRINDRALDHLEHEWLQPDDDGFEQEDEWNSEAANIAEDEFMDERDGF